MLTHTGVIHSAKSGRVVTHELDHGRLLAYSTWLATHDSFWHHQIGALTDYLENS